MRVFVYVYHVVSVCKLLLLRPCEVCTVQEALCQCSFLPENVTHEEVGSPSISTGTIVTSPAQESWRISDRSLPTCIYRDIVDNYFNKCCKSIHVVRCRIKEKNIYILYVSSSTSFYTVCIDVSYCVGVCVMYRFMSSAANTFMQVKCQRNIYIFYKKLFLFC